MIKNFYHKLYYYLRAKKDVGNLKYWTNHLKDRVSSLSQYKNRASMIENELRDMILNIKGQIVAIEINNDCNANKEAAERISSKIASL